MAIGVRFRDVGKIRYYAPEDTEFNVGDGVIVKTERGVEFGEVVVSGRKVADNAVEPAKSIVRKATASDYKQLEGNAIKEKEAFDICLQKIKDHGLDMALVDAQYMFDRNKVLFYFTADGRVDFRELVKTLAGVFRTRIELRQIGVRDEARMLGGIGICGKTLCCATFLEDFEPVSIKMAKEQSLSLNPTKISGNCGRLMCCLKYEQETYEHILKSFPKIGAVVAADAGQGVVVENMLLRGLVKVKMDGEGNSFKLFSPKELTVVKDVENSEEADTEIEELKELE